jgi:aminopeptidase
MRDTRITKLADILVNYSVSVKPEDWVIIQGDIITAPMVQEVYRLVLEAGGHPNILFGNTEIRGIFYKTAKKEQLTWISPFVDLLYNKVDVLIRILGTENTRNLSTIDPQKIGIAQAARRKLSTNFNKRSAKGDARWTISLFPINAYAQEADMSLSDYEDFVYKATFADREDPIAEWQKLSQKQQVVVDWLKGRKELTVKGPHVDLRMSIEGRLFGNSDGKKNMPDGEVFTGPVEDSMKGWIEFTYPAIYMGREVEDVRLEFEDGKVVHAQAAKNEQTLLDQLEVDEGARYVGEFAIGTNDGIQQFTKNMLFDEKMGGTIHLALGASYPETGGKNESAIHWDMLCDMKKDSEIRVDGELLYENGKFTVI